MEHFLFRGFFLGTALLWLSFLGAASFLKEGAMGSTGVEPATPGFLPSFLGAIQFLQKLFLKAS